MVDEIGLCITIGLVEGLHLPARLVRRHAQLHWIKKNVLSNENDLISGAFLCFHSAFDSKNFENASTFCFVIELT